ncbi:MAG: alpha/beta hydrolase family protein [Gammaproteobacteria bacterium]
MKKLAWFICSILIMLGTQGVGFAAPASTVNANDDDEDQKTVQSTNWYDDLFFTDKSFSFEFIRTLGYAYSGGADLGECVGTAKAIPDANIDSWYQEWLNLGNRVYNFADRMQKQNDVASAREAYLRASNYFRTSAFYMVADKDREKSTMALGLSKTNFLNAIASMSFIQPIKIPYDMTALPGYLIRSPFKNSPLLIVTTGFDGTAEELYFEVGVAAYERGYNVLLFEGPGQGDVLRKLNLPFRPDWEHVISQVLDYAVTIPDINKNKIALMGISMGGYLAARAAAFDKRIKACIVNGGIYDLSSGIMKTLPSDMVKLLKENPDKFNIAISDVMKNNVSANWYFNNAMWTLQATTPADAITKLQQYTLAGVVGKIKCPMLVVDSDNDMFFQGQAKQLFDALKSPKTYLLFTKDQYAQAHCQMGAIAVSNEKILHWLSDTFS